MKSIPNKTLAAGIAIASLGLSAAGTAHAGAKAFSDLFITDSIIEKSGGTQFDISDFVPGSVVVNNTSSTFATTTNNGTTSSNTLDTTSGAGNADDNISCVGQGCGGAIIDDGFVQHAPPVGGSFAVGDSLLLGALITGVGPQAWVDAHSASEAQTDVTDDGEGNSSVGTGTTFQFTLANAGETITFDFDATPILEVLLHQDEVSAFASMNFGLTITETVSGTAVFNWNPNGAVDGGITGGTEISDGANINNSRNQLVTGSQTFAPGTQHFRAVTDSLSANIGYTLSIDHRTRVTFEAVKVPEPVSMALMGMGLLGLGAMRRRQGSPA